MAGRIRRVLVIAAHPDDADARAGGTIAKLTRAGSVVTYCVVTNGDKGSSDPSMTPARLAGIRQEEQWNAARVLGVEHVEFLGFPDCELEDTRQTRMAVTAAIRRARPDLVITQNPRRTKNLGASHRDHRIAAGLALDSVYPLARDPLAFPELLAEGLEPHRVNEVHVMAGEQPDLVVDISETIALKIQALACHVSQMPDLAALDRSVRERDARLGEPAGYPYAEAFHRIVIGR